MTDISLKEYFDQMLREMDRRIEQAQRSAQAAVEKAELAIDKRLELLNEFRAQAADESAKYVRHDQLEVFKDRIGAMEKSQNRIYGGLLFVAVIGVANLVKLFW